MTELIAVKRKKLLRKWNLKAPPLFLSVPPLDDLDRLEALFTGRRDELDHSILPLLDGRNILVRGAWGVGKTTFILQLLNELTTQAEAIEESLLPIYIDNFRVGSLDEFYRAVLYALAAVLFNEEEDARKIMNEMWGVTVNNKSSNALKGSLSLSLVSAASLGVEFGHGHDTETTFRLANPEVWVEDFLDRVHKRYDHIVIALDDLDKTGLDPDQFVTVRGMFDGALPILRNTKCAFILTGRRLTVGQDIYGSILGILDRQLDLPRLKVEELHEIAVKTLNLYREQARGDAYPFTDEAIDEVAEKADGIPRAFNRNCADVLESAVRFGYEVLDLATVQACFADVQSIVSAGLSAQMKHLLYIAQQHGGFSQDNRDALKELGAGDFLDALPILDYLVREDLLNRQDDYPGGIRYVVSARALEAAKSPPPSQDAASPPVQGTDG